MKTEPTNLTSDRFQLDVETFEIARSVHRVVRAMHDGECPSCHAVHTSEAMQVRGNWHSEAGIIGWECPSCGWGFDKATADAAMAEFAPVMAKNLAVFEAWRKSRPDTEAADAS